ncbi:class I SAM-dependent methyltransferase [Rhodococcus phenolicus]|uniref:class I SAM-dependent methyltransferase n=1 Tax=Rhodococcus phenolicus TaxID=263849 RepID=UPI0008322B0B|nr:class I SAM-dependent methyltransferase [Rhodococcus phenolicus]
MRCRLCDSEQLLSVLDLGATPPCERFLLEEQLDLPETTYPLHLRLCEECLLLQIPALITPEDTFTDYAYFASYSDSWVEHARNFVEKAVHDLGLGPHSSIVEVASNDGYLLRHAISAGIPCLGIEPSVNVGAAARGIGVPTLTAFLDEGTAEDIRREYGPADLVVANNVYAHIPDLLGFTRALRILVADDGWLSIEVHHALNLVRSAQFDTIYHEHFQYYTVLSAMRALATANLCIVDVELLETHGGSIRLWARPEESAGPAGPRLEAVLEEERQAGLHTTGGYTDLEARAQAVRRDLLRFLLDCRDRDLLVVGYGAPGKGNTLLNYCGIRPDLMRYTVDRNPYKHGRYTPGVRLPIRPPEDLDKDRPDVVVALPWNLEPELTDQLGSIGEWGGRLVFPLPTLHTAIGPSDFVRSVRS